MLYFNSKEDVIDLQLTKYGEYLLSLGRFKPEYYAFFDEGVLYDSQYVGFISESQNNIHDRIKTQTPYLTAQYSFHGLETEVAENNKFIRAGAVTNEDLFNNFINRKIQPTPEKHYTLPASIGTIKLDSFAAPAWSINVLQGTISSSFWYQTGSQPTLRSPQITMFPITYKTVSQTNKPLEQLGAVTDDQASFGASSDLGLLVHKFKDGSFVDIFEDTIILEIEELNTNFENENFDIEVFEVKTNNVGGNTKEILTPLFFAHNKKQMIKNGILLNEDEIKSLNNHQATLDTSAVEYFFQVLTDNEIDNNLLCTFANNKPEGILLGQVLECDQSKVSPNKVLYTTNTEEPDLCK